MYDTCTSSGASASASGGGGGGVVVVVVTLRRRCSNRKRRSDRERDKRRILKCDVNFDDYFDSLSLSLSLVHCVAFFGIPAILASSASSMFRILFSTMA